MADDLSTRLLVVGGGPGGYVAALRAAQLGVETILVEEDRLGGTCLIRGCIPSKALIHAADAFNEMTKAAAGGVPGVRLASPPTLDLAQTVRWKDGIVDRLSNGVEGLLKRARVKVLKGRAVFTDAKTCQVGDQRIRAETVVLATGSAPTGLSSLPFGGDILSSTEILDLAEPPRRLAVVGAGYIGLELGLAFQKLGSEVVIVETEDRILPLYDRALTDPVLAAARRSGAQIRLSSKALSYAEGALRILTPEGEAALQADKVLVTVGRRPRTFGFGLETMAVDLEGPFVKVDAYGRTSMPGVYAVGDLVGEPMLEHKAAAQALAVAETIAGQPRRFDPAAIAAVCFTDPEIVSAGVAPSGSAPLPDDLVAAVFPFQANGRALTMDAGADGGFTRVVARRSDHVVVGLQAVGRHVSELSGEFALALEMGCRLEDLAHVIHVHPTLSETVQEAAHRALGHALHI